MTSTPVKQHCAPHRDNRDWSQSQEKYMISKDQSSASSPTSGNNGVNYFPSKLHYMLSELQKDGLDHIVSWQPHGRCFLVHQEEEFVKDILPMWFCQTKFASFQRQLNLYGFRRLTKGMDRGGFYHAMFVRGKPSLAAKIQHIRKASGGEIRARGPKPEEPDLYAMPHVSSEGEESIESQNESSPCKNDDHTFYEEGQPLAQSLSPDQVASACGGDVSINQNTVDVFPQALFPHAMRSVSNHSQPLVNGQFDERASAALSFSQMLLSPPPGIVALSASADSGFSMSHAGAPPQAAHAIWSSPAANNSSQLLERTVMTGPLLSLQSSRLSGFAPNMLLSSHVSTGIQLPRGGMPGGGQQMEAHNLRDQIRQIVLQREILARRKRHILETWFNRNNGI